MSLQDPISVPPHSNPPEPLFITRNINGQKQNINLFDLTVSVNQYGRRFMSWKGHDIMSVNDYIHRINITRNKCIKDIDNKKLTTEKKQEARDKLSKIIQLKRHAREQNISVDTILDRNKIEAWSVNRVWIKFAYFFRSLVSDTAAITSKMNAPLVESLNRIQQDFQYELKKPDLLDRGKYEKNVKIITQVMEELKSGEPLTEESQKILKDLYKVYDHLKAHSDKKFTGKEIVNKINEILNNKEEHPVKAHVIPRKPISVPNNTNTSLERDALTKTRDHFIEQKNTKEKEILQIQDKIGANRTERADLIQKLTSEQERKSPFEIQKDPDVMALDRAHIALQAQYAQEDIIYQDLTREINKLDTKIASLQTERSG